MRYSKKFKGIRLARKDSRYTILPKKVREYLKRVYTKMWLEAVCTPLYVTENFVHNTENAKTTIVKFKRYTPLETK